MVRYHKCSNVCGPIPRKGGFETIVNLLYQLYKESEELEMSLSSPTGHTNFGQGGKSESETPFSHESYLPKFRWH